MYEVPTLAIINETYFRMKYDMSVLQKEFEEKLEEKIDLLKNGKWNIGAFSEFGLRRRLSGYSQDLAIRRLSEEDLPETFFAGTSNVYLAKKYHLTPVRMYHGS